MIIWVEGPDGSGKSTLVNKLVDTCGYNTIDLCGRMKDKYKEAQWWYNFREEYTDTRGTYVIDRSPLSEAVYRLYDKEVPWCRDSDVRACLNLGKIIYCRTDNEFESAMQRGEDNIVTKESHDRICTIYDVLVDYFETIGRIPVLRYNYKTTPFNDVLKFINRR